MSVSSSIEIRFQNKLASTKLIQVLLDYGWSLEDHSRITYLPEHDDEYEWQYLGMNDQPQLWKILEKKEELNEVIGIALTWKDTNIGFELLIWEERSSICLNLVINRKSINANSRVTDYSWYLDRLIPAFSGLDANTVEKICCEQDM